MATKNITWYIDRNEEFPLSRVREFFTLTKNGDWQALVDAYGAENIAPLVNVCTAYGDDSEIEIETLLLHCQTYLTLNVQEAVERDSYRFSIQAFSSFQEEKLLQFLTGSDDRGLRRPSSQPVVLQRELILEAIQAHHWH